MTITPKHMISLFLALGPDVRVVSEQRFSIFRVEHTFAVSNGKWYFEFEAVTAGDMRVGWARPGCQPDMKLWSNEQAFMFDGSKVTWV